MIRTGLAVIATALLLTGPAMAQQPAAAPAPPAPPDFSKVEIKTTSLGDNMYMLEGQGGNITVAVAKTGVIMVDGQFARCTTRSRRRLPASPICRSNI
jgi:cyclase